MKEILNTMAQAVADQAIALDTLAEQLAALKQTLARKLPDLADELNTQIESEQEKNRNQGYELQVNLAKLREAISQLPEPKARVESKRKTSKAPEQTAQ